MGLREIEIVMLGNFNNRLRYTPSSTLFSGKLCNMHTRTANHPGPQDWDEIRRHVPQGHRLLTIVDTGNCTVSLTVTDRPPVVCGHWSRGWHGACIAVQLAIRQHLSAPRVCNANAQLGCGAVSAQRLAQGQSG